MYSHYCTIMKWDTEWKLQWLIYKHLNRLENIWEWLSDVLKWICWESSWTILDTLALIELQLYEKLSLWDQDVWNVILMFASCLATYIVSWQHNTHWTSQLLKKQLNVVQGLSVLFACIGSGDPVRVLLLYTMNTLDILWSIYCWDICTTCRYRC